MAELEDDNITEEFEHLIATEDKLAIREFLDDQNIADVAELIYEYPEYEAQIIANLSIHRAASTFKILDFPTQKRIVAELPSFKTAELLNELQADDRTSFLEDLPKKVLRDLIKLLEPEERMVTLSLLGYPEDSVGRLMTPDYIYVYEHNTVAEVFDIIRKFGQDNETIDVIYVINEKDELLDDLRIKEFILAAPGKLVSELMDERVIALNVTDDQEYANQVFKMNNRVALPVVDDNNVLLGIITIDDILWVATEEFSEDMQKMGGTEALNEPYLAMPLFRLFRKRIGWLVILFLGEMLTATAMGYFEDEIAKALVLTLFIPLIISSGGNSGSQASTLIIQAMAVGEITVADWWRVLRREILSGVMLGTVLGIIGFVRVAVWQQFTDIYGPHWFFIGCTVGVSLVGVVLWGTLSGCCPLFLNVWGQTRRCHRLRL